MIHFPLIINNIFPSEGSNNFPYLLPALGLVYSIELFLLRNFLWFFFFPKQFLLLNKKKPGSTEPIAILNDVLYLEQF
jgi:hypothetical protein